MMFLVMLILLMKYYFLISTINIHFVVDDWLINLLKYMNQKLIYSLKMYHTWNTMNAKKKVKRDILSTALLNRLNSKFIHFSSFMKQYVRIWCFRMPLLGDILFLDFSWIDCWILSMSSKNANSIKAKNTKPWHVKAYSASAVTFRDFGVAACNLKNVNLLIHLADQ